LGFVVITFGSLVYAACCVANRALKTVNPIVVLFWHGFGGLTIAIALVLVEHWFFNDGTRDGIRVLGYEREQYGYLIGAMLFDSFGCFGQTVAFQSDSSGFVSLMSYISIVYGFLSDVLIFNESFNAISLVSLVSIVTVVVGVSYHKVR